MKQHKSFLLISYLNLFLFLFSCSKKGVETPLVPDNTDTAVSISRTFSNLPADTTIGFNQGRPYGSGRFTLFNLDSNKIIQPSDSNSNKWDIAFSGTYIRLNSGSSGPGQASGFLVTGIYDNLNLVPSDSTFYMDMGTSYTNLALSKFQRFSNYDPLSFVVSPRPGYFFVIKTNNGNYCKLQVISLYKNQLDKTNSIYFASLSSTDLAKIQNFYSFQTTVSKKGSPNWK